MRKLTHANSFLICWVQFTAKEISSIHQTVLVFFRQWETESLVSTWLSRPPPAVPLYPMADFSSNISYTLPFSHRRHVSCIALVPRGNLLLSVDEDGHAILSNFLRRITIHYFSFRDTVTALAFSPSGRHFAAGLGRLVEVWHTPSTPDSSSEEGIEFAPFTRHRVYAGHYDTVQSLQWSADSRFCLSAGKDLTARIWSLDPEEDFVPTTLAGHRETVLGAWFSINQEVVIAKSFPQILE